MMRNRSASALVTFRPARVLMIGSCRFRDETTDGTPRNTMINTKSLPTASALALTLTSTLAAAEIRVPFSVDKWEASGKVEFIEYKGVSAMRIAPGVEQVVLKSLNLTNGIVEFDVEPTQPGFVGVYFRFQDLNANECFYLRTARASDPTAPDAVQYAPLVKGVNLWDLLGHYQAAAMIRSKGWNHIKLVISGARLRAFVNETSKPTLDVPRLEGETSSGSLSFFGAAIIANLVIRPDEVEGLQSTPGDDPTANDARYLRGWKVTEPFPLSQGREPLTESDLPKRDTKWEALTVERRGLVNLSRVFGKTQARRAVWLKTTLKSSQAQIKKVDLGFSDEVWVFINGRILYVDKNLYNHPIRKPPEGRIALENGSFSLPLRAGDNELLIAVANDFFGWGIVARLDNTEGVQFNR